MIGVILWSDPNDKKAVIWCEDQGDLAYLSREDAMGLTEPFFDVGDLVEFEICTHRRARHARNTTRLVKGAGVPSVSALHTQPATPPSTIPNTDSAQIIPFVPHARRSLPQTRARHERRG